MSPEDDARIRQHLNAYYQAVVERMGQSNKLATVLLRGRPISQHRLDAEAALDRYFDAIEALIVAA